jgi:hypothetical protein
VPGVAWHLHIAHDDAWARGGTQAAHGRNALDTWHPLGQSSEQVASAVQCVLEAIFGLTPVRFGLRALNQSCSLDDAL